MVMVFPLLYQADLKLVCSINWIEQKSILMIEFASFIHDLSVILALVNWKKNNPKMTSPCILDVLIGAIVFNLITL